jgi:hypothetical protein
MPALLQTDFALGDDMAGIEYRLGLRERTRTMKTLLAALLWLAVCILGGLFWAEVWGEFGSVVVLLVGAVLGVCGALASVAVSVLQRFGRITGKFTAITVWLFTLAAFGLCELVWTWTFRDVVFITPIVAAISAPLSFAVSRIFAARSRGTSPTTA